MKYVMFEVVGRGIKQYIPVIFPKFLVHQLMAVVVLEALKAHQLQSRVRSAGDVHFGLHVMCSGKSSTLKVESHPDDSSILEHFEYMHGIGSDDGTDDFVAGLIVQAEAGREDFAEIRKNHENIS